MSSKNKISDIQAYYKKVMGKRTKEEKIESDSLALMACFLTRIESVLEEKSMTKKILAKEINTSPSYLTQVFRGDKPLNFITLAKIQKALNIQFEIELADSQRPKEIPRKQKKLLLSH
jgi:ribosome-binding protein aMBF1 (putative translation factor)